MSAKGMEFLGTPCDIFVLDPTHDFLNEQKKQTSLQNVKQSARARTTSSQNKKLLTPTRVSRLPGKG